MKEPLISVVIPVFNGTAVVERAVDSILAQTFKNMEIIIVDDESTDNIREIILEKYKDKVRYYRKKNEGPGKALEYGIRQANGKFIAFLDQDDYWFPEKLEKQIHEFENNPELALVSTDYCQGSHMNSNRESMLNHLKYFHKDPFVQLLLENPICAPSVLVKKEVLFEIGFSTANVSYGPWDRPIWVRMAYKYPYKILREILLWKYIGIDNLSIKKNYAYLQSLHWKETIVYFKGKSLPKLHMNLIKKNCAEALYKTALYYFWRNEFDNFRKYILESAKYRLIYSVTRPYSIYFFIPDVLLNNLKRIKIFLTGH